MFTLGDWQYVLCNYANIKRYIIPKFSNFLVKASDPPAPPGGELGMPGRPGLGSPTNRPDSWRVATFFNLFFTRFLLTPWVKKLNTYLFYKLQVLGPSLNKGLF